MGTSHPVLDPRELWDACVLGWSQGCVCAGRIQPLPPYEAEARQRV